jgi:hypothetical protein
MPKATVTSTTKELELKSLEGGVVSLKRRSYGEGLERRDQAFSMDFSGSQDNPESKVGMNNRAVTQFEWEKSIMGWNLTDENDVPLDWRKANIFDIIDPVVATEITEAIQELHSYETELGK